MKTLLRKIMAFFPSALPNGLTAFNEWADSFYEIYDMPTEDRDTVKWVLSTSIMHLGPQAAYKPKFYFYLTLKAGAAKQVAGAAFQALKIKQQTEAEALLAQQAKGEQGTAS